MDYDSLTNEEWSEYQRLSAKQPDTAAERVDRYILPASKGWAGSRAADSCFEMGDGNEVMRLLLKRVQNDAPLLERLRGQDAWCSSWDEMLTASNPVENPSILRTEFTWAGIKIEVTYKPQWCKLTNTSHLEVCSLTPERARLPITETGYRSHFFPEESAMSEEDVQERVTVWLDEKSESKEWQVYPRDRAQLELF
ncbi:hypothetical protein OAE72_03060 [Akkermansiaceae bacterium]|nr:hypothetical protein [Akkermansiaceae bacterium]